MSHIIIIDIMKYLIPYSSLITIFILGFLNLFIKNSPFSFINNYDKLIGFGVFVIIWILLTIIQNKINFEFLGGGDLMLFCVMSLLIGWQLTVIGIFIGSFIALIIEGFKKNKKHIPFGPYLVVGFIISLLIGDFIFNLIYY